MLARVRCLLRLHRWQPSTADGGGFLDCSTCGKWKRMTRFAEYDPPHNRYADQGGSPL